LHDARAGVIHGGTAVSNAKKGCPSHSGDLRRVQLNIPLTWIDKIADQAERQEEYYLQAILFERVRFGPGMLINLDVRDGSLGDISRP
jgi:hypothetical protein